MEIDMSAFEESLRFNGLKAGEVFRFDNDTVYYMKMGNSYVNIGTGMYCSGPDHNLPVTLCRTKMVPA